MAEEGRGNPSFPLQPKLKPHPKTPVESKFWKSFRPHQIPNLVSSVTSLDFSPTPPHHFAATFSTSLSLFSDNRAAIASFADLAFSASFRCDGKLIAAASNSSHVRVFDVASKAELRRLRGHSRPVRVAKFPKFDKLHLFSGGDDALVKYWDVSGEVEVVAFTGHRDYVRCADGSPASSEIFATGSYDHGIRVWDVRVSGSSSVMEMRHGKPVEGLVFLPSGGLIASAGGDSVKVWDVIGGGRVLHSMESHTKTVTALCVAKMVRNSGFEESRILSVGLDGYMKVFDYSRMKVTHSMKFPAPLLSIAVSPDGLSRVAGSSNGIIFGGTRKVAKALDSTPEESVLKPPNLRYFHRGQGEKPAEGDYLVKKTKITKLGPEDKLLRKFQHKEALVSALNGKGCEVVVPVIEEMVARKKVVKCIMNLETEELGLLLKFLQKHGMNPRHARLLMELGKKVVELRGDDMRVSKGLKDHLRNLKRSVNEEIRIQEGLQEIQGVISPLLRMAGRR